MSFAHLLAILVGGVHDEGRPRAAAFAADLTESRARRRRRRPRTSGAARRAGEKSGVSRSSPSVCSSPPSNWMISGISRSPETQLVQREPAHAVLNRAPERLGPDSEPLQLLAVGHDVDLAFGDAQVVLDAQDAGHRIDDLGDLVGDVARAATTSSPYTRKLSFCRRSRSLSIEHCTLTPGGRRELFLDALRRLLGLPDVAVLEVDPDDRRRSGRRSTRSA